MPFKFEQLLNWQKAVNLSDLVSTVSKGFPKEELYILTAQIKRAADSVALNIAEGSTGQTNPDFNRFLGYAIRSNVEVAGCIFLANRRGIIKQDDFDKIYKRCGDILFMASALRKKL